MSGQLANLPQPPYWAVIFTSVLGDATGYAQTADRMAELAAAQPGYLGVESVRGAEGVGITVSYWSSPDAIRQWREHADHLTVQAAGKARWYRAYRIRVCQVERAYGFDGTREI